MNYEKPQSGNPHKITINQHTFPKKSISRFSKEGKVDVFLKNQEKIIPARPDDKLFCAKRLWNESMERHLMSRIESKFQCLVDSLEEINYTLSETDHLVINAFWALWQIRSETKAKPTPDIEYSNISLDYKPTKDEEEILEKNGYYIIRGKTMPSRTANSVKIQLGINRIIPESTKWGIIYSPNIEFIVPDTSNRGNIMPISPNLCFIANNESGKITDDNAIQINIEAATNAREYFFARDFSKTGI